MSPTIRSDTALSLRGPLHFHASSAVTMVTIDSAATRPRRVRLTILMLRSYGAESTCLDALVVRFKITYEQFRDAFCAARRLLRWPPARSCTIRAERSRPTAAGG